MTIQPNKQVFRSLLARLPQKTHFLAENTCVINPQPSQLYPIKSQQAMQKECHEHTKYV